MDQQITFTVIGGFLGAGKTSFVNRLLANADEIRFAILVNDFGALNIDQSLIVSQNSQIMQLSNGCICCSLAGGLVDAMVSLMEVLNVGLAKWEVHLELKVGINTGAVIAGVIGHRTVQYDLCGDAVNVAARMCQHSLPAHVHVSEETRSLVAHRFGSINRGEMEIKGKGPMTTHFLLNLPAESGLAASAATARAE